RRWRLYHRIIVRLVQRYRKHIQLARWMLKVVFMLGMNVAAAGAGARQRMAGPDFRRKNYCRAIAVMHVAIHRHGAIELAFLVHAFNGDSYIVNHAEALAMIGHGVM